MVEENTDILKKDEKKLKKQKVKIEHKTSIPKRNSKEEVKVTRNPESLVKKNTNTLTNLETENYFNALKDLTEDDIDIFLNGKNEEVKIKRDCDRIKPKLVPTQKKKCKSCGYKRKCHLKPICPAQNKTCFNFSKSFFRQQ